MEMVSNRLSQSEQLPENCDIPPITLCTEGLCLRYGNQQILEEVTLSIRPRVVTAIIGPSGSGKTSFLCCLNRLTELDPCCRVEGSVRVGDYDLYKDNSDVEAVRRRIGMVFQRPTPFPLSIRRNLTLPLRNHGITQARELRVRVEKALQNVGLWEEVADRLDAPAMALSGGQQQRLCIARALVLEPEILLMDEPCSALDPIATLKIEQLIQNLRGRYTIVIVTHDLDQARRIADDVALFWSFTGSGRLIEHGPAKRVFSRPQTKLAKAYLNGRLEAVGT